MAKNGISLAWGFLCFFAIFSGTPGFHQNVETLWDTILVIVSHTILAHSYMYINPLLANLVRGQVVIYQIS